MVSSRSGLVESIATGHWISSSMRRTYFTAAPGSESYEKLQLLSVVGAPTG